MPDYSSEYGNESGRGGSESSEDDPPMSRLFVFCDKGHSENDIRKSFSPFGRIEDIKIIKEKDTGENKGFAYVKFAKTSDAAKAQEELHGSIIGKSDRPLRVFVAASRSQGANKSQKIEQEQCVRLFIQCPNAGEQDLREEFKQWGPVENVVLIRHKDTGNPKGFGYIRYTRFYHAALALENCPAKYKAKFAEPKNAKRPSDDHSSSSDNKNETTQLLRLKNNETSQPTSLNVVVSKTIKQDQLWRLFDIVPGLDYCQILKEGDYNNEAIVVYHNPESAIYAKEKVHGFEYPVGERIIVKLSEMSSAKIDTSFIEKHTKKDTFCSVPLPQAQPMAPNDAVVAKRLFMIMPTTVPVAILKNIFSCWPGLIDLYFLPNKSCGYVKYADAESAMKAMETLSGAEICGTKIKIVEAEEQVKGEKNGNDDVSRKRMRRN
ncbi:RNA-binding protein 45 [Stomoxys calcitrans]|uniref:RRM domain-containing protein n=1 Tax=Stomoxys calcitrans TaxID=35570 RepID=A0A1I8PXF9_STOCA|nr:RNA-binding protein 45 [Stomoxys calcitrans]